MKTLRFISAAVALAGALAAAPAPSVEYVVVVSRFAASSDLDAMRRHVLQLLLRDGMQGAKVSVWEGDEALRICAADIPVLAHDNPDARAERLAAAIVGLKKWTERVHAAAPVGFPAGRGDVRLPEFLAVLPPVEPGATRHLLVLATPFYQSPQEPTFSMNDSRYPSDAHLLASIAETPFGTAERAQTLRQTMVHWAYGSEAKWTSGAHHDAIERWWSLWIAAQSGQLATFAADTEVVWSRFIGRQTRSTVAVRERNSADVRLEMRSAQPRRVPDWLAAPLALPATPVPAPVPVPEPPAAAVSLASATVVNDSTPAVLIEPAPLAPTAVEPQSPAPRPAVFVPPLDASKTGIGIAWSAKGVDLDLYVVPQPGAQELSYRRDRTKEGFLYRDMRNANSGNIYEFVEFTRVIDLSHASIWINYYAGSTSNVTGQVVLYDRGTVKVGTFTLKAARGNRGSDERARAKSAYWTEVRLVELKTASAPLLAHKPENSGSR